MIEGLLLPRTYLSYSAWHCWRTNPVRFRREYFEKGRKLDTKYLRFGKGIAKAIEDGSYIETIPNLPVMEVSEQKIIAEVLGVPILSFIDTYDPLTRDFGEFKTGINPWTKAKVQKHDQLLFYAVAIRAWTKVMPRRCLLHWIETTEESVDKDDFWANVDKQLSVTGRIESFERVFDERELERMEKEILKSALEISEAYKSFINEL